MGPRNLDWNELADLALKQIRASGADYGDIRILASTTQSVRGEDRRIAGIRESLDSGFGTLTGMTRDGTFLIEGGKIACAVRNFRFHDSPLRAFNCLEAFTAPVEATTGEGGQMLVPALKIRDFNFSSVTRF